MTKAAFDLYQPDEMASSVVFASPHSGSRYFDSFMKRSVLDAHAIRSSEDAFVDQIFKSAPEFGAPLIAARAPRAFVDMNRSPDELDPALIDGARRWGHNPRVAFGLGVIPRVVSNGRAIYSGKLTLTEARNRIDTYWHPYHDQLKDLLSAAHARFGQAILIDCHSMPHEAVEASNSSSGKAPEIVLGDRFGAAASGDVVDQIEAAFASAGFKVARNAPFAGAYVAQAYGRPSRRQHAVQVEIDRSLYMNERTIEPNDGFDTFCRRMRVVVAELAQIGAAHLPLAAE